MSHRVKYDRDARLQITREISLSIVHCGRMITFHGLCRMLCVAIWHVHAPRTSTPDHTHSSLSSLRFGKTFVSRESS